MEPTMPGDGRKRKHETDDDTDTKAHIKTPPRSHSVTPDVKYEIVESPLAFDPGRVPNRQNALSTIDTLLEVIAPLEAPSKSLQNIARNARRWAKDPARLNPVKPVIAFVGGSGSGMLHLTLSTNMADRL
ncbi:hypothetical protein LTR95_010349 [Oleoguttula sp. CCFEE 5521]